jgi:hypothetical protein
VFLVQILLVILLSLELISQYEVTLGVYPPTYWVIISRFVCGIVLHMQLQDELKAGLGKMKFAINHSYKFKPGIGYQVAFMSGLMQASMIMVVEIVNVLVILSYADTLNVVICFCALAIIAEFDNFFYEAIGANKDKELLEFDGFDELLYTIRRTSSSAARGDFEPNKLDDPALDYIRDPKFNTHQWKLDGVKAGDNYIKINFRDRSFMNKVLMCIYRVYRCIYINWFYFFPFLCLLGSFYIPFFVNYLRQDNRTAIDPEFPPESEL